MGFNVHEGSGSRPDCATYLGREMTGGTSTLLGGSPSSVDETMFGIMDSLLQQICCSARGEDIWNVSPMDQDEGGSQKTKLTSQESQENNADV